METIKLLDQNMTLSEQKKSSFLGGDCLLTAGIFYCDQGAYELALNYLTKALLLFHRYDEPEWIAAIAKTQIIIGSVYHQQGDFETALSYYLLAEEITTDNNDFSSLQNVLSKIVDCYLKLSLFGTASIYARKNQNLMSCTMAL